MKNIITCLVLCVLNSAAIADTWTVDDDGSADFNNIQAAVDAVVAALQDQHGATLR